MRARFPLIALDAHLLGNPLVASQEPLDVLSDSEVRQRMSGASVTHPINRAANKL